MERSNFCLLGDTLVSHRPQWERSGLTKRPPVLEVSSEVGVRKRASQQSQMISFNRESIRNSGVRTPPRPVPAVLLGGDHRLQARPESLVDGCWEAIWPARRRSKLVPRCTGWLANLHRCNFSRHRPKTKERPLLQHLSAGRQAVWRRYRTGCGPVLSTPRLSPSPTGKRRAAAATHLLEWTVARR